MGRPLRLKPPIHVLSLGFRAGLASLILLLTPVSPSVAQEKTAEPGPVLGELVLEGATVFSRDDVIWLLQLRTGQPLPASPERVAELLERRYERDGYSADVVASYDEARQQLTLRVDEARVDEVRFEGLQPALEERFRADLGVRAGDLFNKKLVRERLDRLLAASGGALRIGSDGPELVSRGAQRVLVVPIDRRRGAVRLGFSSEAREDFFSPVDGFAPALSLDVTRFDPVSFNHTFVRGHLSYKFARDDPGYTLGIEQPLLQSPRAFVAAELYDVSTSDDLWRLSTTEQSLVALTFRNTFRDYYRRRGTQLSGGARFGRRHEVVAALRWDEHRSLANASDFSFFRDEHPYRASPRADEGDARSLVVAYTVDSRGLDDDTPAAAYERHRLDDLYRSVRRQSFGWRADWTSEISGRALGGDLEFDRHLLNARTYIPLGERQSVGGRVVLGFSRGVLPVQRRFALGGIGTVHGYAFKEAAGGQMSLVNVEYRLDLTPDWRASRAGLLRVFLFYDAGQIRDPVGASRSGWLQGTGFGVQSGPVRLEFGFRTDAIPTSRQILVRITPTF